MIYRRPTDPNNSKLSSLVKIPKPLSPRATPARINPIICGILNRFRIKGANNMTNSTNENISTGFVTGRSMAKFLSISNINTILLSVAK